MGIRKMIAHNPGDVFICCECDFTFKRTFESKDIPGFCKACSFYKGVEIGDRLQRNEIERREQEESAKDAKRKQEA
jgi:hypothetical protein